MDLNDHNSVEGKKLDQGFKLDLDKVIKITSTKAINEEELFEKIMIQIEELQAKRNPSSDELTNLFEQIKLLPDKSDLRLQCEFHYRNLKKKLIDVDQTKSKMTTESTNENLNAVDLLKKASNPRELEPFFIKFKWPDFINIGNEGRRFILDHLISNKDQFHDEKSIIKFVEEESNRLKNILEEIPNIKDEHRLLVQLNKLHLKWFQNQSNQVKEFIASLLVEKNLPQNLTLTTLDDSLQKAVKEANQFTTVPIDLLKNGNELHDDL